MNEEYGYTNRDHQRHLDTEYWRLVRRAVWRRAGGRCERCGVRACQGTILDVHHLRYDHHGDELNHLDDLIMVCREGCHAFLHRKSKYDPCNPLKSLNDELDKFLGPGWDR